MDDRIKAVFFKAKGASSLQSLEKTLSKQAESFEVISFETAKECVPYFAETKFAMLFFFVKTPDDMLDLATVLSSLKKDIKAGNVRVIGVSEVKVDRVLTAIQKYGANECLPAETNLKSILFKVEKMYEILSKAYHFHLEALKKKAKEESEKPVLKRDGEFKLSTYDCWFFLADENIRFARDTWFVELVGPPPSFGSWLENKKTEVEKEASWWNWIPKNRPDEFVLDDGLWQFYGRKPEFSWAVGRWLFASKKPILHFSDGNAVIDYKMSAEKNVVTVRNNPKNFAILFRKIQEKLAQEQQAKDGGGAAPDKPKFEEVANNNADWGNLLTQAKMSFFVVIKKDNGEEMKIEDPVIADLFENEITLKFDSTVVIPDNTMTMEFSFDYMKDGVPAKYKTNADIMGRINIDDGKKLIELTLESAPPEVFDEFLKKISEQQRNVVEFMKLAKG